MTERERNPLSKAFQALTYLSDLDKPGATLSELATGVGLKPSTMHRVLAMLEAEELVQQDAARGRYSLGWKFMHLAQTAAAKYAPRELVRPHLTELRNDTGETAWFAIHRAFDQHVIFIESVESTHPMRHVRDLNAPVSLFAAGAAGRLILALSPEEEQAALLASGAAQTASQSFVDPAQLKLIRTRQYALSASERGGVGIAVPTYNPAGKLHGVVGIGLPQSRFDPDDEPKLVKRMQATAANIAAALG